MLAEHFETMLHSLGMERLEHPLFYHAPVAIRFEIGGDEPVYLDENAGELTPNPAYVQNGLERAATIYRSIPEPPDILRIDGYPEEELTEVLLTVVRQRTGLPAPHKQIAAMEINENGDTYSQVQFYWDLRKISFQSEQLLREIILGDIGGWNGFVASVYLAQGRGQSSITCTMTVGWMCWAVHGSCCCLSIGNSTTGSWGTIWRESTGCSPQQKNDPITEKEASPWDLTSTLGR